MKKGIVITIAVMVGVVVLPGVVFAEEVCDLGEVLQGQTVRARLDFAEMAGFTKDELGMIMVTRRQIHRIQDELQASLVEMAVALQSESEDEQFKRSAVEKYMETKKAADERYDQLQSALIEALGANEDPLKMGALIVLGVIDSGRRITCAVQSSVSGGVSPGVHGQNAENLLRGSFRTLMRPVRRGAMSPAR
ncbi:MAG: hypothetical protein ACLFWB_11080 [Armatimonadota bacterium]